MRYLSPKLHPAALPCAIGGGLFLCLGMLRLTGLCYTGLGAVTPEPIIGRPDAVIGPGFGGVGTMIMVGACLLLIAALAAGLVYYEYRSLNPVLIALLPIGAAVFLRCLCLDHVTLDYVDFLSDWAAFFRENGGWKALALPKGDYNVPYLYFMALLSYIPIPDLYGIKLFSILFDVILAWAGLRLVKAVSVPPTAPKRLPNHRHPPKKNRPRASMDPNGALSDPYGTSPTPSRPLWAFSALLLLPTVVLNGAFWGQCDSIYAAFCLLGFAFALEKKSTLSVINVAIAFSFKLQTVFLLPLWAVLWMAKKVNFKHLLLFPVTYFVTILPALLAGKPLGDVLSIYVNQTGTYSQFLSMNASSVYALIPYGAEVDVALAAKVGIIGTFLLLLALLGLLLWRRDFLTDSALLTAAALMAVGIPLFLPHMHDRYFFLADCLVLLWCTFRSSRVFLAAAVQFSSLCGYFAYLFLRYLCPMSWGAISLLIVLFCLLFSLITQLFPQRKS